MLDGGGNCRPWVILREGFPKVSIDRDLELGQDIHPQDDLGFFQPFDYYKTGTRLLSAPRDRQFSGDASDVEGRAVCP